MSAVPKHDDCYGCSLYDKGRGFAYPIGPVDALITIVGEALGKTEAEKITELADGLRSNTPFVGAAGMYLNRGLSRLGLKRPSLRVGNVVQCQPPNDWLVGAPWEHSSITHCRAHRDRLYRPETKVYLTLGMTATRTVAKEILDIDVYGKADDWHGYILGKPPGPYVVPSYHPAYMLRGNQRLFGTFLYDLRQAMTAASFGYQQDEPDLVVDPPVEWFREFVESIPDDPDYWLSADIETTTKDTDEEEAEEVAVGSIYRINFASHPDQGITIPWEERYRFLIDRLLRAKTTKVFWNARYDVPVLARHGTPVNGTILDGMWAWHLLQTDTPKGLGFVAPFYSKLPPWKHLRQDAPGLYCCYDPIQALRCTRGILADLKKVGLYETFWRYCVELDRDALVPMTDVGLQFDRTRLAELHTWLEERKESFRQQIQSLVPPEAMPLAGGWKREPSREKYPEAFKKKVMEKVLCCTDCGETEVGPAHKCKKERSEG